MGPTPPTATYAVFDIVLAVAVLAVLFLSRGKKVSATPSMARAWITLAIDLVVVLVVGLTTGFLSVTMAVQTMQQAPFFDLCL